MDNTTKKNKECDATLTAPNPATLVAPNQLSAAASLSGASGHEQGSLQTPSLTHPSTEQPPTVTGLSGEVRSEDAIGQIQTNLDCSIPHPLPTVTSSRSLHPDAACVRTRTGPLSPASCEMGVASEREIDALSDTLSVCSEKSGLTTLGEEVSQMKMAEPGFIRLTSQQRRIFKSAQNAGKTRAQALELALANKPQIKRQRSEEESPNANTIKKYKTAVRTSTNKQLFSEVIGLTRVGIVSPNMIDCPLTSAQTGHLQEAIIDVVAELADNGSIRPSFVGCQARSGWLMVTCTNKESAVWVENNFKLIQDKCDFPVLFVEDKNFPKTHVVRGYFPQSLSTTNEKILTVIRGQNHFSTAEWKVVQRKEQGPMLHLIMVVDDASYTQLVTLGGVINYRYGRVKLMLKGGVKEVESGKDEAGTGDPTISELPVESAPDATIVDEGPSTSSASQQHRNSTVAAMQREGPSKPKGEASSVGNPWRKGQARSTATTTPKATTATTTATTTTTTVTATKKTTHKVGAATGRSIQVVLKSSSLGRPPNSLGRAAARGRSNVAHGKGPRGAKANKLVEQSLKRT